MYIITNGFFLVFLMLVLLVEYIIFHHLLWSIFQSSITHYIIQFLQVLTCFMVTFCGQLLCTASTPVFFWLVGTTKLYSSQTLLLSYDPWIFNQLPMFDISIVFIFLDSDFPPNSLSLLGSIHILILNCRKKVNNHNDSLAHSYKCKFVFWQKEK